MKKFLLVTIALFLPFGISAAPQKKRTKKRAKTSVVAKKETATPVVNDVPAMEYTPFFQGELVYVTNEVASKFIRTVSAGNSWNGDRTQLVTVAPEGIKISDLSTHLHTVLATADNQYFIYSDLTNNGFSLTKDQMQFLHSALDLNYSQFPDDPNFAKSGNFETNPETFTFNGDICKSIRGNVKVGDANESDVEIWYSDLYQMPPAYRYFLYGYHPGGVVKKFLFSMKMDLPVIGNVSSTFAGQLVGVEEKDVELKDILPPEDISIVPLKDIADLYGFYKANNKELKKRKLVPKKRKAKEVKKAIKEQWAFADEWMNKQIDSNTSSEVEQNLLQSLTDLGEALAPNNGDASEAAATPDNGNNGPEASDHDGELYIPDLIAKLNRAVQPMRNDIEKSEKNRNLNAQNTVYKRERIGTSYVDVPVVMGLRPTLGRADKSSKQSVIKTQERIISSIINYGRVHHTDYIPKEKFKKLYDGMHGTELEYAKQKTQDMKEHAKMKSRGKYRDYVNMLMNHYHFDKERDLGWIKKVQANMKRERERCGCEKSKWEDWDGASKMD